MLNLVAEPLIRATTDSGGTTALSLPAVLAALGEDRIATFPALRPHQRHVWHAFLVQIAVLALGPGADDLDWPADEAAWRDALRALTADYPGDEPWSLVVEDLARPAFLQPPVPEDTLSRFKNLFPTPDALDMLVTAKSHDLKAAMMIDPQPDDWIFALLSLQTQEGYSGATQYGITRMNGGFASRPALDVVPPGGLGASWRRDVRLLRTALADHDEAPRAEWDGYDEEAGLGLVWLQPWDGTGPLDRMRLHPLYIEICRRVRLAPSAGRIVAHQTGTKGRRIVEAVGGTTGDPWTPVDIKNAKALTVPAGGFHYRRMSELLFGKDWALPLLARVAPGDTGPLWLVARALTRGQGKTEGFHERTVPLPALVASRLARATDDKDDDSDGKKWIGDCARSRIEAISELQAALGYAARVLVQGGPQEVSAKATRNTFTEGLRPRLEALADATFFEDLWAEVEAGIGTEAWEAVRHEWLTRLYRFAFRLLFEAGRSLPVPLARRSRARTESERAFRSTLAKKAQWKDFLSTYWKRFDPDQRTGLDASEDAA